MIDSKHEQHEQHVQHVQSVDRTLDILEVLATKNTGIGVTELAGEVGLSKGTTHRLLQALHERGYVEKRGDGTYKLGLKLIEVVSLYINNLELQTEARPYVAMIAAELGLTSHLGVLDGDQVVYIEKMDVYPGVRLYSQIGLRVHAYCSSLGKCLLSNYSKTEVDAILKDCSFNKFTPNTIDSLELMHEELKLVRRQGWAMDNREYDLNNRCIGAPIYDYRGEIVAAISASGSPTVLSDERISGVSEYLMEKAMAISRSLGYTG
jgi:DNA-binding IclR family transcriptional regulator